MKLSELKEWVDKQLQENGDNDVFISVDVGTCDEDSVRRIFADPISIINHGAKCGYAILAEKVENNNDRI